MHIKYNAILMKLLTNKTCLFFSTDWGFFKLDAKSKTEKGVEFKTSLSNNRDSGKVSGNLETKYKWSDLGMFFFLMSFT